MKDEKKTLTADNVPCIDDMVTPIATDSYLELVNAWYLTATAHTKEDKNLAARIRDSITSNYKKAFSKRYRCPSCNSEVYLMFTHYRCTACKSVFTWNELGVKKDDY